MSEQVTTRDAFYDLVAIALMTGNARRANQLVAEAGDYLPDDELAGMVRQLEAAFYEFT